MYLGYNLRARRVQEFVRKYLAGREGGRFLTISLRQNKDVWVTSDFFKIISRGPILCSLVLAFIM